MNDFENGYDAAHAYLHPGVIHLEEKKYHNKLPFEEQIDLLLELHEFQASVDFKRGVATYIEQKRNERASLERRQTLLFPLSLVSNCEQCTNCRLMDDKTQHLDQHFRINTINNFLQNQGVTSAQKVKCPKQQKAPCKRERNQLQTILHKVPDLNPATRKRIETRLYGTSTAPTVTTSTTQIATSSIEVKDTSSSNVFRGWFSTTKAWQKPMSVYVPPDIVQYGRMVLPNKDGFWMHLFGNRCASLSASFESLLVPSSNSLGATNFLTNVSISLADLKYGSKAYMKALTKEHRDLFLRADDRYDIYLCALCGVAFEVVASQDADDFLEEDYVLLDAFGTKPDKLYHGKCTPKKPKKRMLGAPISKLMKPTKMVKLTTTAGLKTPQPTPSPSSKIPKLTATALKISKLTTKSFKVSKFTIKPPEIPKLIPKPLTISNPTTKIPKPAIAASIEIPKLNIKPSKISKLTTKPLFKKK